MSARRTVGTSAAGSPVAAATSVWGGVCSLAGWEGVR